ncbi:hypothetical protein F4V43_02270 [Paenibacillus spiritus]|uniref:Uncharacterized protein n=1 Tax=Paenibacillus spiritus TaxID=2496557 RepID=A0A5J5GGP6_9BACL|nr:hypothetical protein [Paenibacillus spiritus]KAA9007331.1 hypothetical protein F4V43_02270 [Paenibacillus spiritus]
MTSESRSLLEILDLFELHEIHNLAMVIKTYSTNPKEFEKLHSEVDTGRDLLLIVIDILDSLDFDVEELKEKIDCLNDAECEILVKELVNNNEKYFQTDEN